MSHILAVDAGNTKTVALVAGLDGTVIGYARTGCGDIYGADRPEDALDAIASAAETALVQAGIVREEVSTAVLSAAGADWPGDFDFLHDSLSNRGLGRSLMVVNDAIGALCAGSPDGTGVVVAVGTGVATGARGADGLTWHSGFWQRTQGAKDMAGQALDAVFRAELGLDAPTMLTSAALDHFGVPTVEELLFRFTGRAADRPSAVAGFAPALLSAAAAGDRTARQLVIAQGAALGDYVLVAARKVGIDAGPYALVLTGGVLRHRSSLLADAIIKRVQAVAPQARPLCSQFEPAAGALFLAFEQAGVAVDDLVRGRVTESFPPASFFATGSPDL